MTPRSEHALERELFRDENDREEWESMKAAGVNPFAEEGEPIPESEAEGYDEQLHRDDPNDYDRSDPGDNPPLDELERRGRFGSWES